MHTESMDLMSAFVTEYDLDESRVIDIGSLDINGTYKSLFTGGAVYIGVDIQAGPNVDVIMDSAEWGVLAPADAVISGQTFEHVADVPALLAKIFAVLKPGGYLCFVMPSTWPTTTNNGYPAYYGLLTEGEITTLVEAAGFTVVRLDTNETGIFLDVCCVARRPAA